MTYDITCCAQHRQSISAIFPLTFPLPAVNPDQSAGVKSPSCTAHAQITQITISIRQFPGLGAGSTRPYSINQVVCRLH